MNKIKLLLADDNKLFVDVLAKHLHKDDRFEVISVCYDGNQVLQNLESGVTPDVLILDIIMPYLDGICILEKLPNLQLCYTPKIIIMSAIGKEDVTNNALELGADFYVLKPFNMDNLANRICKVYEQKTTEKKPKENENESSKNIEELVTNIMYDMGIPSHMCGFQYLRESIILAYHNTNILNAMTKVLYIEVASKFKTKSSRVERSIRHAIEISWERGSDSYIQKFFEKENSVPRNKPSNGEFISTVLNKALKYKS